MSLRCFQSSFGSIRLKVWEMSFEEFQDGRHLGYWNGTILVILKLWCLWSSFGSIRQDLWVVIWRIGCHLGYREGMVLAILNLNIAPMPPIKFLHNLTYGFGGDVVWIISIWPPWRPSWISEQNNFSNSESLLLWCLPSSFGSIGLTVWEMSFEEFQDGRHGSHLGYRKWTILAVHNLHVAPMSPFEFWPWRPSWISKQNDFSNSESQCLTDASHHVSAQSDLWFWRCHLKNFNMAWRPTWISERKHFSKSEFLCHCDASHQVSDQSDLWFGRRRHLKNFKMVAMAAILDIGTERF